MSFSGVLRYHPPSFWRQGFSLACGLLICLGWLTSEPLGISLSPLLEHYGYKCVTFLCFVKKAHGAEDQNQNKRRLSCLHDTRALLIGTSPQCLLSACVLASFMLT